MREDIISKTASAKARSGEDNKDSGRDKKSQDPPGVGSVTSSRVFEQTVFKNEQL